MTLIRSVSGVRGTVGDDITVDTVERYARAFARSVGGVVAAGFDGRRGGAELHASAMWGLVDGGARVLDAGIVPTPTVGIAVRKHGLDGGIVITASHNPESQNGMKFFSRRGIFLTADEAARLFDAVDADLEASGSGPGGSAWGGGLSSPDEDDRPGPDTLDGILDEHMKLVLGSGLVDVEGVRSAGLRVVVDCVNGAGSVLLPRLLKELGCDAAVLGGEPGGGFTRGPEPVPMNLGCLREAVADRGADLGMACDPDADRLALVDERGEAIGEEYTLALACRAVLRRKRGPVVANVSTSRMVDDAASDFGVEAHRSPVGEVNVVTKMEEVSAVVGGEGNGGVILPEVHPGRDACTAAALVLTALRDSGKSLSQVVASLPSYSIVKTKLELAGATGERLESAMKRAFPGASGEFIDGAKMTWPDRWVHARMSGTEPVVRIIAEAPDQSSASELVNRASEAVSHSTEEGLSCAE